MKTTKTEELILIELPELRKKVDEANALLTMIWLKQDAESGADDEDLLR